MNPNPNPMSNTYTVILVYSTSHALRAEKILKNAGVTCELIPVPRHLSSDCGICVRISATDRSVALEILTANGVENGVGIIAAHDIAG